MKKIILAFLFIVLIPIPSKLYALDFVWAPGKRVGPEVIEIKKEGFNGYDNYDGYFWMYNAFKWTGKDIENLKGAVNRLKREKFFSFWSRLVYEFRRGDGDRAAMNEHWDGIWAQNQHRSWFIFGYNKQLIYTEYITSLPGAGNDGSEEHDLWFTQVPGNLVLEWAGWVQPPPSWSFDKCDIFGKPTGGMQCDEEYEISANPLELEPDRTYFVAIKFRTDREDGTGETEWAVRFLIEEPVVSKDIYIKHSECKTDSGKWSISYDPPSLDEGQSSRYWEERCVDSDGDGILDFDDNCDDVPSLNNANSDGDRLGDVCDPCPGDPYNDADGDGICYPEDAFPSDPGNDTDGDGIAEASDNCPQTANSDQMDTDGDGAGDACDSDDDNDGFDDSVDALPLNASESMDTDHDGIGNNRDTDDDNDGYLDFMEISLGTDPLNAGSRPADNDGDLWPDGMDRDDDNDGVEDAYDLFPLDRTESGDWDGDGIGDNADPDDDNDGVSDLDEIALGTNPMDPVLSPRDTDGDGIPDTSDPDDDNDGVPDVSDAFPLDATESRDSDGDGLGDRRDLDDDNDLYTDEQESRLGTNPLDPTSKPADYDGDLLPDDVDPDIDNDDVPNGSDPFPRDSTEWVDTDGDGIGNNADPDDDNDHYNDDVERREASDPLDPSSTPADFDGDYDPDRTDPDDDNDLLPDTWEISNSLNPKDPRDAFIDSDEDGAYNYEEYLNGTDPHNDCSPPKIDEFCYNFYADGDSGQCGGATGVHCVPVGAESPSILVDTDNRAGGCWQSFSIKSHCAIDATFCVDFEGGDPGADLGQCGNAGKRCAPVKEWTDPILLDMDSRNGWCSEQFFISSEEEYTFVLKFWGDGGDSQGQCQNTGSSKSFSKYHSGTQVIGMDTDSRPGGCWQSFELKRGTWSVTAF